MAAANGSPLPTVARREGWAPATWPVVRFGLCVLLISLALSLVALPWFDLSWWRVFRRCVSVAAAMSLWLTITKFERRTVRSYGFQPHGVGKRPFLFGVLLGLGALGLMLAIGLATGVCQIQLTPDHARLWRTALSFLPFAALVGLLEELAFRGFILQHLLDWSTPLAVTVSSTLYAVVHLKTPEWTFLTALELGGLFLLGCLLAFCYLRTQQLYLAIGLHASLAYGARLNKLLIEFSDPSMAWLVGTSRLINGVASWIALLVIGAAIAWWTGHVRLRRSSP